MQTVSRVKRPKKVVQQKSLLVIEAIEAFLQSRSLTRCRPKTISNYRLQLTLWAKAIEENSHIIYIHEVEGKAISSYIAYLTQDKVCSTGAKKGRTGLSAHSVNTVIAHLKGFFNHVMSMGWIDHNPMTLIKRQRAPIDTFEVFNDDQVRRLLAEPDISSFCGLRDYAIMLVFIDTGIRLGELLALEINDICWNEKHLRLRADITKSGRPRLLPLSDHSIRYLRLYIANRPPEVLVGRLWCTFNGGWT